MRAVALLTFVIALPLSFYFIYFFSMNSGIMVFAQQSLLDTAVMCQLSDHCTCDSISHLEWWNITVIK